MISNTVLNLNILEAMNFFWTSIASKDKLPEKFIHDLSSDESFEMIYNEEFTQESVRRCLSALSNREPFSGNKVEARFYSRNLMILEYIDSLDEKINAFKSLQIKEITNYLNDKISKDISKLEIVVVPSPFETVQVVNDTIILNFFKFHIIDGVLKADDQTFVELIENAIK